MSRRSVNNPKRSGSAANLPELRECEHVRGKIVGLAGVAFELAIHRPPAAPILFRCCALASCVVDLVGSVWTVCPDAQREHNTRVVRVMAADLRARFATDRLQSTEGGDRDG